MNFKELSEALRPHQSDNMEQDYKDARIKALQLRIYELEDLLDHANSTMQYMITNINKLSDND
jgi:hypothetical protein|tara:strand:+ start:505 stop:693 length:189 start_codon:yes stop_codon:yes gene_type:complete